MLHIKKEIQIKTITQDSTTLQCEAINLKHKEETHPITFNVRLKIERKT